MEVVKLALYQSMVNYRKEMSFGYVQTYPLPTPSMVRGMAHALLDAKEYYPLKISIQGTYGSVVTNMQKVYKFDRDRNARPDNPYNVTVGTSHKTAKHGLLFVDQLVDVNLLLHIAFEEKECNRKLYEAVHENTIVLGRNEDIARVDTCQLVALQETDEVEIKHNMYVPSDVCKKEQLINSTAYRLPFKYADVASYEDKRIFDFVDVRYIDGPGRTLDAMTYLIDDEEEAVFLLGVPDA